MAGSAGAGRSCGWGWDMMVLLLLLSAWPAVAAVPGSVSLWVLPGELRGKLVCDARELIDTYHN
ncbi:hypothetical protein RugamoR1_46070 [Rugamonas sp. R1(2021)]